MSKLSNCNSDYHVVIRVFLKGISRISLGDNDNSKNEKFEWLLISMTMTVDSEKDQSLFVSNTQIHKEICCVEPNFVLANQIRHRRPSS